VSFHTSIPRAFARLRTERCDAKQKSLAVYHSVMTLRARLRVASDKITSPIPLTFLP
jgi:hypothetical protein